MSRKKQYDYQRIDRAKYQDDWYLQRRREMTAANNAVQAKLDISEPGDQHEQEADTIARTVASGGTTDLSTVTPVNNSVQSKSENDTLTASSEFSSQLSSSKSSGQPMDETTKAEMESKMGSDFSGVKIHTGSAADSLSEQINAKAFTEGNNIFFKNGNYNPSSDSGKQLLAHELTHTVQQGNSVSRKVMRVKDPGPYIVKAGDTIESICQEKEIDKVEFLRANKFLMGRPNGELRTGEELTIPDIQEAPAPELDPNKVDQTAITLAQILGFGFKRTSIFGLRIGKKKYITNPDNVNAKPEQAIQGYRYVHNDAGLNDAEIADLYKRYPGLVYEMDENLPVEFRESDEFGFFGGIAEDEKVKLLDMLSDIETWKDAGLLDLTLKMVVNGMVNKNTRAIDPKVLFIIKDKRELIKIETTQNSLNSQTEGFKQSEAILAKNGFENGQYVSKGLGKIKSKGYSKARLYSRFALMPFRKGALGYSAEDRLTSTISALAWLTNISKKLNVKGASLNDLQKSMGGTMGGFNFTTEVNKKGKAKKNSREGKVDLVLDNKEGYLDISATSLPFNSANYQGGDYTFQSDSGYFAGVHMLMTWPVLAKDEKPAGEMLVSIPKDSSGMNEMVMTNLLITMPESSFGIGKLKIKGLKFSLTQSIADPDAFKGYQPIMTGIYLLMDVISVLQNAVTQSLNRFTIPGNEKGKQERNDTKDLLEKFMMEKGLQSYDLEMSFDSLEIENFVYVDQDYTRDDNGKVTNKDAAVKTSVIKNISTGKTTIKANSSGIASKDKDAISNAKYLLVSVSKNRDLAYRDVQLLKLRQTDLSNQLSNSGLKKGARKKLQKDLNTVSTQLVDANKKLLDADGQIKQLNATIGGTQSDLEMNVSLETENFKMSKGGMLDEIGSSIVSDFANNVEGLGDASATKLSFKTSYNQYGTSDMSLGITGLKVPQLTINDIYYATADKSFILQASQAMMSNISGDISIGFNDHAPSPNASGNDQYDDKKAIDKIATEVQSLKQEYALLPPVSDAAKQKAESISLKEKEVADKQKEYDDRYGLIASIYLKSLVIPTTELCDLQINTYSEKGSNEIKFPSAEPVLMQNLEACDLLIGFGKDGMSFAPGPEATQGRAELMSITVPAGAVITNKDLQDNPQLAINLQKVVAGQLSIDFLKDNVMEYQVGSLTGGGDMTQFGKEGQKDKKSKFNLPGSDGSQLLMSGTISDSLITTKVFLPKIELPFIDVSSKDLSITVPDTGNVSLIEGITVDAAIEKNPDKKAKNQFSAINFNNVVINSITAYGFGLKKGKISVNVPSNTASTIFGLYLRNLRFESSVDNNNEVVWKKAAVMGKDAELPMETGLSKLNFSSGLTFEIENKLSATLKSATSDKIDFDIFQSGDFNYDINNLDLAGEFWMKNKKGIKTVDLKSQINTTHLGGSFNKIIVGEGDEARFQYSITGTDIDIPSISAKPLNIISSQYELHVPKSASKDTIFNGIKGSYTLTLISPSQKEKDAYAAKAKKAEGLSKTAETKKERDDYALEAEAKAPWDIYLNVEDLTIDQIQSYGLHFTANSETKVVPSKDITHQEDIMGWKMNFYSPREYVKKIYDLQLPNDSSATMNKISLHCFDVHIPRESNKKVSFTGSATIGDKTHKGIDIGPNTFSITTMQNEIIRESFGDQFETRQNKKEKTDITSSLSVNKFVFDGKENGEFDITVDNPKVFFPNTKTNAGGVSSKTDDFDNNKTSSASVTIDDLKRKTPVIEANQIIVSRKIAKAEDGVTPLKDTDGNIVFNTVTKIVKPKLQDISIMNATLNTDEDGNTKNNDPGDLTTMSVKVGGTLDGNLLFYSGTSDFAVKQGEEKDEDKSFILEAENPTDKLSFTSMDADLMYWPKEEMSIGQKKSANSNLPADDYAAINSYTPTGKYNFLDGATGTVTIHLFNEAVTVPILSVNETKYKTVTRRVKTADGYDTRVDFVPDGTISGTGYINLRDAMRQFEVIMESRSGIEITENPYYALTNLTTGYENGNVVLQVDAYGFINNTSKVRKILCPDINANVLSNGMGTDYVKLSAMVDYQANKPQTVYTIPGADEDADAIDRDLKRIKESSMLDLSFDFNAKIDMSKLSGADAKSTNEQRGLLKFITGNQSIAISGSTTVDNTTLNSKNEPFMSSKLSINEFTVPPFRYPVEKEFGGSDLIISGQKIHMNSLKMESPNSSFDTQHWKTTSLSIEGLKVESRNHPAELRGQRK